jgi:hypothetical protein
VEADRDAWQRRAEAVEPDRDRWREHAETADAELAKWRERAEAAMAELQAKEKDAAIQSNRYRVLEERLKRIERTKGYRIYVALTRRFLSGGHRG